MAQPRRVLLLTANIGSGHSSAALAIQKVLNVRAPDVETLVVNSLYYAHSLVGKVMEDGYLQLLKYFPWLYGFFYERKERSSSAITSLKKLVYNSTAGNFKDLITTFRPSLLVCTHAFPCGVLAAFKEKHHLATPLVGCVTDFVVHPYWLYPNVETYTVAHDDLKKNLVSRGVAAEKVCVTGIPIDSRFAETEDRDALKSALGFDDGRPVILVMGGGLGLGPVEKIVKTVEHLRKPMHLVVFTGRNRRTLARLESSLRRHRNSRVTVHPLDYVDNVPDYMKAADLLVTKPGGLSSSEALACGLPILIVRPLPGQEYRNTRYLVEKKVARRVKGKHHLAVSIEQLLDNPQLLARMKSRALQMAVPDSASRIADIILEKLARQDADSEPLRAASSG